jgi:hypothetical protein
MQIIGDSQPLTPLFLHKHQPGASRKKQEAAAGRELRMKALELLSACNENHTSGDAAQPGTCGATKRSTLRPLVTRTSPAGFAGDKSRKKVLLTSPRYCPETRLHCIQVSVCMHAWQASILAWRKESCWTRLGKKLTYPFPIRDFYIGRWKNWKWKCDGSSSVHAP